MKSRRSDGKQGNRPVLETLEPRLLLSVGWDVVLIDATLPGAHVLAEAVADGAQTLLYDGAEDTASDVLSMVPVLARAADAEVNSVSILSHGRDGQLSLGNEWVSADTMWSAASAWSELGEVLTDDANIYLLACDLVGSSGAGGALLDGIASLTGADVFASSDLSGALGDWQLEAASCGDEAELAAGLSLPLEAERLEAYRWNLGMVTIPDVPSYIWYHGCGPTAAGMVIGYWDAHGYGNLISGSNDWNTNQQTVKDMIASPGHIRDYAPTPDRVATPEDPYHTDDCVADFNYCSRGDTAYGLSSFGWQDDGLANYAAYRGYTEASATNYTYYDETFWALFVADIDAGRPVEFLVDTTADGVMDHYVTAVGYDDTPGARRYACYNTFDHTVHWYEFGIMATGRQYGIHGGTFFDPGPPSGENQAPSVGDQVFSVDENSPQDASVGTVEATDPDLWDTLTWTITEGNTNGAFVIDSASGLITVANPAVINYETHPSFNLTVEVTDSGGLADTATITITLNDLNEAPVVTDHSFAVNENSLEATAVGTVLAADPDAGDVLTYTIMAGNSNDAFAIDSSSGLVTVNNSAALDYETTPTFDLTVEVTDAAGLSDIATVTVTLQDEPSLTVTAVDTAISEPNMFGSEIGTFVVTRTGDTSASLIVYYVVGGTAADGTDYDGLTGSVTIPAGSATAEIVLSAKDDNLVESGETVTVTLVRGSGHELRTPATAAITIVDNDAAPFVPSAASYVSSLYIGILCRAPTAYEQQFWTGHIESGAVPRAVLAAALSTSAEFETWVAPIIRLYHRYLGRSPDTRALSGWVSLWKGGMSLPAIQKGFALSPEFIGRHGDVYRAYDNRGFVIWLYETVLGRTPAESAVAWQQQALEGGFPRELMMVLFTESAEHKATSADRVHAAVLGTALLSRAPQESELDDWAGDIEAGVPLRVVTEGLLNSQEYQRSQLMSAMPAGAKAQIARLYEAYLGRPADYNGLMGWSNLYRAGVSLSAIARAFALSPAFAARHGEVYHGTSDADFVPWLYATVLGRDPTDAVLNVQVAALSSGLLTREQMMTLFTETAEYKALSQDRVDVTLAHAALLNRAPTSGEYENWANWLGVPGNALDDMIDQLVGS